MFTNAFTAYMNHPAVRAALGIRANASAWKRERDLSWRCSNDDEAAFRSSFGPAQSSFSIFIAAQLCDIPS